MPYTLETDRLFMRPLTEADAAEMYALNADPEVIRYTGDGPFESVEAAAKFLREYKAYELYGVGRMAVILKDTGEITGWCGLKYHPDSGETDLGYRLMKKYWNMGIATESSLAHLNYGIHTLGLKRIIARAMHENAASIRVMIKCGFVFEQNTSECMDEDGFDGVQYVYTWPRP
jgi:RimJ/RimL family protein N-acetyltransferase